MGHVVVISVEEKAQKFYYRINLKHLQKILNLSCTQELSLILVHLMDQKPILTKAGNQSIKEEELQVKIEFKNIYIIKV
jgi:hypothetical protein